VVRTRKYPIVSEADYQAKVIETAQLYGWRVAHFRPMQSQAGEWRTAVAADGKGFPDLVLVHPTRGIIFAELKSEIGQLAPDQKVWRDTLIKARGNWHCWKPSDWPVVEMLLRGAQ
jgi:hypothetical protein